MPKCENPDVAGIVCVGAVDNRLRERSVYSSYGSNVDLMAPGGSCLGGSSEDILSTVINSTYDIVLRHVAGRAARRWGRRAAGVARAEGQEAADRIVATAADSCVGLPGECGAGVVDAAAAVEGLGPPTGGPGEPTAGSFSTKRRVKRRAVRRHGFRVMCDAVRPGECRVRRRRRGRRIARGQRRRPGGHPDACQRRAQPRAAGGRSKHMGRRLRVRVVVTLPGEGARTRRVTVRR